MRLPVLCMPHHQELMHQGHRIVSKHTFIIVLGMSLRWYVLVCAFQLCAGKVQQGVLTDDCSHTMQYSLHSHLRRKLLTICLLLQKVQKMQSRLHYIGSAAPRQHKIFVDDEAAAQSFSAEQHFDTPNELLDRNFNRPRTAQLQEPGFVSHVPDRRKKRKLDRYQLCLTSRVC